MKILVIVPAYNEEKNIESVINDIKAKEPLIDILVVNDGSSDNTGLFAERSKKIELLTLPFNLGIGGAMQAGFKYAKKNNYDIIVKFDGDGQHKAEEIKKILSPVLNQEADMVIGSRFLNGNKSYPIFARRIGQRIFSILISIIIGQKITDSTSGFRCYNKQVVSLFNEYYPSDYPEPEEIILLKKNKFKMKEVWVSMSGRKGGSSSITIIKSAYYMVKVILALLINLLRAPIIKEHKYDK